MDDAQRLREWNCTTDVTDLCAELIRIPSENPPGDCGEIADMVAALLRDADCTVENVNGPGGLPSVVGTADFGPGPTLLMNGHMDVVPIGDLSRWSWDPFGGEVRDGYVLGRGASDMKGGLAALLVAVKRAVRQDGLRGKLVFVGVPDEETGGEHGTRFLLDRGIDGDACLIGEPSGIHPTVGQKGNLWLRAVASGVPAHGSLSPLVGVNAIRRMAEAIDVLYGVWETSWPLPPREKALIAHSQQLLLDEGRDKPATALGRVSVNVGLVQGGEKVNIVAGRCEAQFDLRIPIGLSAEGVLGQLRMMLAQQGIDDVELACMTHPNEPNYTDPQAPFVRCVVGASRDITGEKAEPVLQWASSDARFYRYRGIPTVQYGPAELEGIHGYDERVPIQRLVDATRVYALVIERFLGARWKEDMC